MAVPVVDLSSHLDFAAKAGRVLDLYQRGWDGRELAADEYVISADEKSQRQVLSRCHPVLPSAPGRVGRVEFEYERGGTVAYLAAYDVHRAKLMGRVEPTTGIAPFAALVDQVMTAEPYGRRGGCFGWWTTAPRTPGRPRSPGWPKPGLPPPWCTCQCMHPG